MSEYKNIILQRNAGVTTILLNRVKAKNALSENMIVELKSALEAEAASETCTALVLRGVDGVFCAGGDIKDMEDAKKPVPEGEQDPLIFRNTAYGDVLKMIVEFPAPVISVCEGVALGGGFGFVCVSDIVLAERDTLFGMPEIRLGIPPAQIGPYVVRRLGLFQAMRLAMLAERFNGDRALELGLVHGLAEGVNALDEALKKELSALAKGSPEAIRKTKALFQREANHVAAHSPAELARMFSEAIRFGEGQEGVKAFTEKRSPNWSLEARS
ncbi:MAG: enoyl-CoA hydratase/isomerase family protein [Pseudomonadota bacterium]